jgi:Kdo2-lipid IVA lauroyltransferase/acyltransferase
MADRTPLQRRITRIIRPLEALIVHGAFALFRAIPVETASAIGGKVARTIGPRLGITRRARKNLQRVFPEKPAAEIEAIIRDMWENLGRIATEYPHLSRMRVKTPDANIEVRGLEHVTEAQARGKPMIFFAGHLANWEVCAIAAKECGAPLHLVYRPANNPWVEEIFREGRSGIAAGLLRKGAEGARSAVKLLRDGHDLGILIDQKMNDGIAVPFFGRDAMTAPALARLALRFDCAVLPVQAERLEGARFRVTVHPLMKLERSDDVQRDTLALMTKANALLEDWIRQRPAQWLWLHRRWPD